MNPEENRKKMIELGRLGGASRSQRKVEAARLSIAKARKARLDRLTAEEKIAHIQKMVAAKRATMTPEKIAAQVARMNAAKREKKREKDLGQC